MPLNVGETDYDALMLQFDKRFSNNYSVRVSYTLAHSFGNTSGQRRGGERLPGARRHAPGAERGTDGVRSAPQLRGQRHGARSAHRRPEFQLGRARAVGSPFSLTNANIDPDRNGTIAEPLPAGEYSGTGDDGYTVKGYEAQRNGAYGPGLLPDRLRGRLPFPVQPGPGRQRVRGLLQRHRSRELRQPDRQPGQPDVPGPDRVQHELHAAQTSARREVRVLGTTRAGGLDGIAGSQSTFQVPDVRSAPVARRMPG